MPLLNEVEARIVGALLEKEFTTPDYYPPTLNALLNACNQKTSREPVVDYDEATIEPAVESLREKRLVYRITGQELRVPKYRQGFAEFFNLDRQESAVMMTLLLRGPQTLGELKSRSNRAFEFAGLPMVMDTVEKLIDRDAEPLVKKLPRQPGKDVRYMHLLCGEEIPVPASEELLRAKEERILALETEFDKVRVEIEELKQQFAQFKKQFE
jgi:hypothetical protein